MTASDAYKRLVIDGQRYYGRHLILGASGCSPALLEISLMRDFLAELVQRIDMVAYGEPIIARFGEGIEIGLSAVQLIETSAITVHTNDGARDLYLDVFSCKDFAGDMVCACVREFFAPAHMQSQEILRR